MPFPRLVLGSPSCALSESLYLTGDQAEVGPRLRAKQRTIDALLSARRWFGLLCVVCVPYFLEAKPRSNRVQGFCVRVRSAACSATAASKLSSDNFSFAASPPERCTNSSAYARAAVKRPSRSPSIQIGFVDPITRGLKTFDVGWYGLGVSQYGAVTPGPVAIA